VPRQGQEYKFASNDEMLAVMGLGKPEEYLDG
jgi:hypothetical protein